jgi:hypothetical protein
MRQEVMLALQTLSGQILQLLDGSLVAVGDGAERAS